MISPSSELMNPPKRFFFHPLPPWTLSRNLDLPSLQAQGEREETTAQEGRSDQTSICKANGKAQK